MKQEKKSLGMVVHSSKDFRALKSYTRYVTPFFYITKIIHWVTLIMFISGVIGHNFFDLPMSVSVFFVAGYFGSLAINCIFFDRLDQRIYVGEAGIAIKHNTITKKYAWTDVKNIIRLSRRVVTVEYLDGTLVMLKRIRRVDELMDKIPSDILKPKSATV